jgi:SpoVK/Ycf46/Vps4 family AAA+-type ATPase
MGNSVRADLLKHLVRMHAEGDEEGFRKAALQVAAAESAAGHTSVAQQIREILASLPPASARSTVVDIAQARGPLADVLEAGHRPERLKDIVLAPEVRNTLQRVLQENRSRTRLQGFGVSPRRRLLFHGPPGCGKTLAASVMAGELGVPLMTVRFDALFSRFLGATANHLRAIFNEMPKRPGVYLFDEFDAVAKARGSGQDVGEMQRIVTSFLQLLDADRSASILIAATNHAELLDRAVFRRFDVTIEFARPTETQVSELLRIRLASFDLPPRTIGIVARAARDLSFADVARACDDAIRTMALDGRERVTSEDITQAMKALRHAEARRKTPGVETNRG